MVSKKCLFESSGDRIFAISNDQLISSLTEDLQQYSLFQGNEREQLTDFVLHPVEKRAYACSRSGSLMLWDTRTVERPYHTIHHTSSFTSLVLLASQDVVVTGDENGSMKSWCLRTGLMMQDWTTSDNMILSMASLRDDSFFCASNLEGLYCFSHENRTFEVIDHQIGLSGVDAAGECYIHYPARSLLTNSSMSGKIHCFNVPGLDLKWASQVALDHIESLALYRDGSVLVCGLTNGTVCFCCTTTWQLMGQFHLAQDPVLYIDLHGR